MDLTDKRILHLITTKYTFFSNVNEIFASTERIKAKKSYEVLKKLKKIEIILSFIFNHNMKLVINDKMKIGKFTNMKAKQHTPEQLMNQRRNQSRNKKCFETNENGNKHTKTYRIWKNSL